MVDGYPGMQLLIFRPLYKRMRALVSVVRRRVAVTGITDRSSTTPILKPGFQCKGAFSIQLIYPESFLP